MSGINWDVVNMHATVKSQEYAKAHPNHTVENAYFQGCIQNAAERESLRVINERQEARIKELEGQRLNTPFIDKIKATASEPIAVETTPERRFQEVPATSLMGSFM